MVRLKQFLCGIFINHSFRSGEMQSDYNHSTHEITITETCCICGKKFSFTAHESKFGL